MPTKRAKNMFLFSLLLLLGAWISKLLWLYYAFASIIVLIFLSYLLSKLILINIDIKRVIPQKAYEGQKVTVEIQLKNKIQLLDQALQLQDVFTPAVLKNQIKSIYFNGLLKGKINFSYQGTCYKRGLYKIGPFKLKVFDPLGLFYSEMEILNFSSIKVYPSIFTVHNLPFILGHLAPRFGEQTTRISGNYEEFYGIREYQQEDGLRKIHWRSTARNSDLMVRHFEQSSQWNSLLVLDAFSANDIGYGKDTTFEYAIKIIASLTKYLLLKNASFGLLASSANIVKININKGRDHFYRIMDELSCVKADGQMRIQNLLAYYQNIIPPSCSLIFATPVFEDSMFLKFLKQLKMQKNIGIIPVILDSNTFLTRKGINNFSQREKAIKKVFSQISSQVYVIDCKKDLSINFIK